MSPGREADSALAPPVARVGEAESAPYDWIAEPTVELIDLLDAERAYYEARVAPLAGLRATLAAEMAARVPTRSESAPWRSGDYTYREIHEAGAEFPTLVRRSDDGRDESIIDLQAVADAHPGAEFHPGECEVSPDGKTLAWSSDVVGDERYSLRFRDLVTGADLPGVIESTFPSGGWSADSTTYLYLRTDKVNRPHQVWAHSLGADPATDRLVFAEPDGRFEVSVDVTRSGEWFVITASSRNTTEVRVLSCAEPAGTPLVVRPRQDLVEYRVEHAPGPEGDRFLIVTNLDAESFRIVSAPVDAPEQWNDYAAEDPATRIYQVHAFGSAVVVSARRDGVGMLTVHPHGDKAFQIWPDEPGGLVTLGRNEVFDADFVTVVQQSFIHPTRYEDVDIASGRRSPRHIEPIVGVDPDDYVQERHLAPAAGRHRGARRRRAPPRCRPRRHATALSVRLRLLRSVHGPRLRLRLVALAAVAARSRGRLRVRSAARRWRAGPALVAQRSTSGQAQHIRRPGGRRRLSCRRARRWHSHREPRAVGGRPSAGRAVLPAPRALRRDRGGGALRRRGRHHVRPVAAPHDPGVGRVGKSGRPWGPRRADVVLAGGQPAAGGGQAGTARYRCGA